MKKYLAMLCAAMLCACCLGLAACGGASSSSAASSSAASASASASTTASNESASASAASAGALTASVSEAAASVSPAAATAGFVGEWKFAGAQMDMGSGAVTMVGNLATILGDGYTFSMTLKEDGTGTFAVSGESVNVTWSQVSDESIVVTATNPDSEGMSEPIEFFYANGVLTGSMVQEGQTTTLMFSKDGTVPGALEINAANGRPITQESDLVGDWKISGMSMMGLSIYGDSNTIATMSGNTAEVNLNVQPGGTATFGGQEITYTVGPNGASLNADGVAIPVMALGDGIMVDLTQIAQMDMFLAYSK